MLTCVAMCVVHLGLFQEPLHNFHTPESRDKTHKVRLTQLTQHSMLFLFCNDTCWIAITYFLTSLCGHRGKSSTNDT